MSPVSEPMSDEHGYGLASARPAAGIVGRFYYATDTATLSRDNGTTWDSIPLGASLTVEEVDGSPTDSAITKIKFPNGTLGIASHVATYTPAAALTVQEEDGSPTGTPATLKFPNGTVVDNGDTTFSVRQVPVGVIGVSVYCNADADNNISSGVNTKVAFAGENYDTDGFHSNVTNNSRITIPAGLGGKYLVGWNVEREMASVAAGKRWQTYVQKNGAGVWGYNLHEQTSGSGGFDSNEGQSFTIDLVAGDYLEVNVHQDSGSAKHVWSRAGADMFFAIKLDSGRVGTGIGCTAHNSAVQSIANDAATHALTLDTEDYDTDGFHSTSVNTSRMTVPTGLGGKYLVIGSSFGGGASSGIALIELMKNGTTAYAETRAAQTTSSSFSAVVSAVLDLAAGDYVELVALQTSSGAQNFGHASARSAQSTLSIMRLDSPPVSTPLAHGCRINRSSGNVSVGNNTYTVIGFTAEDYDSDAMHDTVTNNSRVVIPQVPGVTTGLWGYKASGYTDATTGRCDAQVRKNAAGSNSGGSLLDFNLVPAHSSGISGFEVSGMAVLAAGDYIELFVRTSGGSGNVLFDSGAGPVFEVFFLGLVT